MGVFGQRYAAAGMRISGEFRANHFDFLHQIYTFVAALGDDQLVVVWDNLVNAS